MWFPEKNDPEAERLAAIIWDLRRDLFLRNEYLRAQEGVWETEEEENRRDKRNEERLREYDMETLRIIRG